VGLRRRGPLGLQGFQGLLREREDPGRGLHVQQVHGELDQVQDVGPRVVIVIIS